MLRPRTALAPFLSTVAAALSLTLAVPAVAAEEPAPVPPESAPSGSTTPEHTSDSSEAGVAPRATSDSRAFFDINQRTLPVAPGLEHTRFDRYDERGWIRVNVLSAELSTPGLRLDYLSPGRVTARAPLSTALQRRRGVAGVNGDFFDIKDTGAPMGVGVDRGRGVLHGSSSTENKAFLLDRDNVAQIAKTYLQARIVRPGKPDVAVTNLNAPVLQSNGIGIYTTAWGATSRTRVLPGPAARREVVVRAGRVRANRRAISSGPIKPGVMHLVGTGRGAKKLANLLPRGTRVSVEYGLNRAATRVAVGGNVILLRNGRVLAPGDDEMHPRTAIGIDRDLNRVIVLTADGRSSLSRGLTMNETARLLQDLGAEDALNLDGGGSSTMLARESGEPVTVVNSPSDGRQRAVPNGLGFSFTAGSGKLRGIRVEPAQDSRDSHRVLRGLTRVLAARGHDESYAPVAARPTWQGSAAVAAQQGPGARTVIRGRRTGTGTVTASAGGASGQFEVRVLGPVHRLEASVPSLALAGKGRSAGFEVRGYDAHGFDTWVEPRDIRLVYDRDKLAVRRTARGLVVRAKVASTSEVVKLVAGGKATFVGVTVGLARNLTHRMDSLAGWQASAYPARADARLRRVPNRAGRAGRAIALQYALLGNRTARAAYLTARPAVDLPDRARRIGLWVRGDRKGAWLRALVRDRTGSRATVTLSRRVSWRGWRFVSATLPAELAQPLDLVRVYAVETNRKRRYRGVLAFDDLTVFTERTAPVPRTAPVRDPLVADLEPLPADGLRVAVLSDARISGARPRSAAVARTRRVMREAVAAGADLVLLNGDLVARGDRAGIALARRVIDQELEGKVAWHYAPGEHEIGPSGDLAVYRGEFGNPVRVLDRAGTRFVLLNSAQSSFRFSGFAQLVRLRSALDAAAADRSVSSVVVVAHHPTSDPTGGSAELTDAREGDLVEQLLSGFRATSGKQVAYVGGHGRRFTVTRDDGVPQVLAGAVNNPLRAGLGAFSGWALLRVGADGVGVELRPLVDRLAVTAPSTLAAGRTARAAAWVTQAGRRVQVSYPMSVRWLTGQGVHVGAPADAPASAVVAYDPVTGRLTALKQGTATLTVQVNGVTASRSVTVR